MYRGSNFIKFEPVWPHPAKMETKAHFCWTCRKKTGEWHNSIICNTHTHNKYCCVFVRLGWPTVPVCWGWEVPHNARLTVLKLRGPEKLSSNMEVCEESRWEILWKNLHTWIPEILCFNSPSNWLRPWGLSQLAPLTLRSVK